MTRSLVLGTLVLASLALTGCPAPDRTDTGVRVDAPGPGTDAGDGGTTPPPDVPVMTDTPSTRACSVGAGGCDVIAQSCPDMGTTPQGCYLARMDDTLSTICAQSGALVDGATCTNVNDCAEGFSCQDGTCRKYCCMEATSDCPLGYICQPYGGLGGETLPVGICVPPADCEVVPQSGCPTGDACVPGTDGTLLCVTAGPNAAAAICGRAGMPNDGCQAGSMCIGRTGEDFHCQELCVLASPSCPRTGTTCTAIPSVVGGGYGLCVGE